MAEMNDIVKLAVDAYHGRVEKYSVNQSMDTLRQALVDLNGGSTILDYKKIRDGECKGLFTLVETILSLTVREELHEDDLFMALCEFRDMAEGDKNLFIVEDDSLFGATSEDAGCNQFRRVGCGMSLFVRLYAHAPHVTLVASCINNVFHHRHAFLLDALCVKVVLLLLAEQEDILVSLCASVSHAFGHRVRLVPNNILSENPSVSLHSEGETPRDADKVLRG